MNSKYICHTGKYHAEDEKIFSSRNRAFCYGDAIFETIRCLGTEPVFFDNHWRRLTAGMKALKMDGGETFSKAILRLYIGKLLNKNRIFKGARIRLTVYRDDGGLYTPTTNDVSWILESSTLENEQFALNSRGLHVDIFDGVHKQINQLSNLKTANALPYVLAGIFKKEQRIDDCLILNQYGRICESISSNIFILYNNKLITPPLEEGCIAGTMRHTIMQVSQELGYPLEEKGILEKYILEAEEVFVTNSIQGVQWIGGYKEKRYFNFVTRKLVPALNKLAFSKREL